MVKPYNNSIAPSRSSCVVDRAYPQGVILPRRRTSGEERVRELRAGQERVAGHYAAIGGAREALRQRRRIESPSDARPSAPPLLARRKWRAQRSPTPRVVASLAATCCLTTIKLSALIEIESMLQSTRNSANSG